MYGKSKSIMNTTKGLKMTKAREFLLADISAMLDPNKSHEWLHQINDGALLELWKDLVHYTTSEEI